MSEVRREEAGLGSGGGRGRSRSGRVLVSLPQGRMQGRGRQSRQVAQRREATDVGRCRPDGCRCRRCRRCRRRRRGTTLRVLEVLDVHQTADLVGVGVGLFLGRAGRRLAGVVAGLVAGKVLGRLGVAMVQGQRQIRRTETGRPAEVLGRLPADHQRQLEVLEHLVVGLVVQQLGRAALDVVLLVVGEQGRDGEAQPLGRRPDRRRGRRHLVVVVVQVVMVRRAGTARGRCHR